MKTILSKTAFVATVLFVGNRIVLSQGSFANLDFEHPITPLVSRGDFTVSIADGLPGWTGYIGGVPVDRIFYNTVSLGAAAISLHSSASGFPPIQGDYSVILQPSSFDTRSTAEIAQTGQIPLNAVSLLFYGFERMEVTFGGLPLTLVTLETRSNYHLVGANVSAFAGQTGELKFLMPDLGFGSPMVYLDDIQFSPQPVPEPDTLRLFVLGGLVFSLSCWCSSRRK
jgi:hypothetical protein